MRIIRQTISLAAGIVYLISRKKPITPKLHSWN